VAAGVNEAPARGTGYLTFQVGAQQFALDISKVQEIRGYAPLTPLPGTPSSLPGVMNLRGTVVPVMDVRRRLGMQGREYDRFSVIVVATKGSQTVGLLVEAVSDVVSIARADANPVPPEGGGAPVEAVALVGDRVLTVLDLEKLWRDNGDELAA